MGLITDPTREASAFVAAEAITLAEELAGLPDSASDDPIADPRTYAVIEGALLFMIGGYDINAVAAIGRMGEPPLVDAASIASGLRRSGGRLLRRINAFCQGRLGPLGDGEGAPHLTDQPATLDALEWGNSDAPIRRTLRRTRLLPRMACGRWSVDAALTPGFDRFEIPVRPSRTR